MPVATSSFLVKTILHNSIAEGIYNEIANRTSRYYYFLGKTLAWEDETSPPTPVESYDYELDTRNEIITMKEIKPTDVSFVIPRIDWQAGERYDQYDDQYSDEVQGINLIDGGFAYGEAPRVYVGTAGSEEWAANTVVFDGDFLYYGNKYYVVIQGGTTGTTAPTHADGAVLNGTARLEHVVASDNNGYGASAIATVFDGNVIDVQLTSRGRGYTSAPTVIIAGGGGQSAYAEAVFVKAQSGANKLEDARFYVLTDEYHVYKCLNNNNGGISTVRPSGTTVTPFVGSDGYIWKYMYTIPIALRNKFLTSDFIPIVTALRQQFFSNGELQTVRIDNSGSGYSTANIVVTGDGYLESDPQYCVGAVITNQGSNYTGGADVDIDSPVTNAITWEPSLPLTLGTRLQHVNHIYEVVVAGTTGSTGPSHRVGATSNGTCGLKYIGTKATGIATVSGGKVTGIQLDGMIRNFNIINKGYGYNKSPVVNITANGSGTGAAGVAIVENGHVVKIVVTDPGFGYSVEPTVTFGTIWTSNTQINVGDQVYYSDRLYTCTASSGNKKYTTTPVHLSGTSTSGDVTLAYVGEPAVAEAQLKFGSGYSTEPTITITPKASAGAGATARMSMMKSEAILQPIISNETAGQQWQGSTSYSVGQKVWWENRLYIVSASGVSADNQFPPTHTEGIAVNGTTRLEFIASFGQLVGVQIDNGGVGYTYVSAEVVGDGEGAKITVDLSPGNVNTFQANNELLTPDGAIYAAPVVSQGWGYTTSTVPIIIRGDGTGAEAHGVITNGALTKVVITNQGSGYRWATFTVTGNGHGAKVRAIISPFGGHGKYALNELYARTLMFYSNISTDSNQGFDVNNDYRQVGVIKNPRRYSSTQNLTSIIASGCWAIGANSSTSFFTQDMLLTVATEGVDSGKRFRIVTNTGTAMLLQSLDNASPYAGMVLVNDNNQTITVDAVTAPTVDKYSGDLLFIDNNQAFTPTDEQFITLRTVITM